MTLRFVVPRRPVSVNASYAKNASAFYMTKAAKDFKEAVAVNAFAAAKLAGWTLLPLRECHVFIDAFNSRHDVDGVGVKIILDALQGIAYGNDRLVKKLTVTVNKDATKKPRVEIAVTKL